MHMRSTLDWSQSNNISCAQHDKKLAQFVHLSING